MYVVFWTEDTRNTIFTEYEDFYSVVETEALAKARYEMIVTRKNPYCAGYGPISQGTEPHWMDSETNANIPIKEK